LVARLVLRRLPQAMVLPVRLSLTALQPLRQSPVAHLHLLSLFRRGPARHLDTVLHPE
jgi:hypothetical protein